MLKITFTFSILSCDWRDDQIRILQGNSVMEFFLAHLLRISFLNLEQHHVPIKPLCVILLLRLSIARLSIMPIITTYIKIFDINALSLTE